MALYLVPTMNRSFTTILLLLVCCGFASESSQSPAPKSPTPSSIEGLLEVETVAEGLEHPWALAFLPDGRMLVTERPGRMRTVSANGQLSPPLKGVPTVFAQNQGGLLDVKLDPQFSENRRV